MKETENNSNNSAEFNSRWCNAGGVNVNQWIKQRMDEINHENETALEEKVKKAALGCYYCGVAPPTLSKIFPVHLKFSPPIVEQIYTEWKASKFLKPRKERKYIIIYSSCTYDL